MQTPKVVTDALVPDLRRLPGGLVLQPLSIAHTLLLQKIESPFLGFDPAAKANAAAPAELDLLAVVYLLTRTEAELDALFFGFDRPAFTAEMWHFAKAQSPALLIGLQEKLADVFAQATSTLIGGGTGGTEPAEPAGSAKKKIRGT